MYNPIWYYEKWIQVFIGSKPGKVSKRNLDICTLSKLETMSVWSRIDCRGCYCGTTCLVLAIISWNIWRERNYRIFNNTSLDADCCIIRAYLDISLWTCQLSDRKRVCISEDEDNHLQDDSPVPNGDKKDDFHMEEFHREEWLHDV